MNSSFLRNLALLVARIGIGYVFLAHGWQKLHDQGLAGTTAGFKKMGVPAPEPSAYYSTFVELIGGAALIFGLFAGLVGVLLVLDMLGAFFIVHLGNGVFVGQGGYELVVALGAGALLLAVLGAGKFGLDGAIVKKSSWIAGLSKA
jgi:putative oxidoreductase